MSLVLTWNILHGGGVITVCLGVPMELPCEKVSEEEFLQLSELHASHLREEEHSTGYELNRQITRWSCESPETVVIDTF